MESFRDVGSILFLATLFVITVPFFVTRYGRGPLASPSPVTQPSYRVTPRLLRVSLIALLMSVSAGPALAQDLFTLTTDTGYEYFIVDSEIVQPQLSLTEVALSMNLELAKPSRNNSFTFRQSNTLDRALTLDPGFQASWDNDVTTIVGRIQWNSTEPQFKEGDVIGKKEAVAFFSPIKHPEKVLMANQATPLSTNDADTVN